jgi:hypothetical protein
MGQATREALQALACLRLVKAGWAIFRGALDLGEMGMVQRPPQKGFDLLIEALAGAVHLRFGDSACPATIT